MSQSPAQPFSSFPFPTTDWSVVTVAGNAAEPRGREAQEVLLRRYLPAMTEYLVTKHRLPPDQADDLVQGFVTSKVLEQNLLGRVDLARGRFRNFLMTALDRYLLNRRKWEKAGKRAPAEMASIDDVADPSAASYIDLFE